jgi:hypothetical protein
MAVPPSSSTPSLVNILVRMVDSALAWEAEHGVLTEAEEPMDEEELTFVPSRIHCRPPSGPQPEASRAGRDEVERSQT